MEQSSRFFLLTTLCAIATSLLYCFGLGGDFILDDAPTISDNPAVHVTTLDAASLASAAYGFENGGGSRALPMLTFGLDHWRAGLDPTAFKATNILIHALTTLAMAGFLRLLLSIAGWSARRAALGALAMALAWALHPLLVSSVLYVVQRMQTMATLFVVLALWAYLKARQAQIDGQPSRRHWILVALSWVLALACKEDALLLPGFALVLELTVLHFRAQQPTLAKTLRKGYLLASITGLALFVLVIAPHYWQWDHYPFRDFSTYERLLTQARILVMYLGQIVFPLPGHMPFFYDDLPPSRGLLQPVTTLWSLALLAMLAASAWYCRKRRPLYALGVLLFFVGHAISSNVVGLELVFEHRNHFPLVGIVVAVGDLLLAAAARLRLTTRATGIGVCALLCLLATSTAIRLHAWSDPLGFAQTSTRIAPGSERAWTLLCQTYHDRSGGDIRHPDFAKALDACQQGTHSPHGISALVSVIVLKSDEGTVTEDDWNQLLMRAQTVAMTPDNVGALWYLAKHSHRNARINERNVVRVLDITTERAGLRPIDFASLAYYMAGKPSLQEDAYRYYAAAVAKSPPSSSLVPQLLADLEAQGKQEWAANLRKIADNESRH